MFSVVLAGFCAFLTLFMTQPLLPEFAVIFHASTVMASLTVTAATLGVALAAPLIGTVADRFGRKSVIVWSALLLGLSTLAGATAMNLPTLIFWRFVEGLCTPGVFAITVAYIQEEWSAGGAGTATAAYVSGTVLGGFCGRLVSGIVESRMSWHWSFIVIGTIGLLGAAALWIWLPEEQLFIRRSGEHSTLGAAIDHLRNKQLLATFIAGACVLFSLLGTFTFITFYLAAPPFRMDSARLGALFFVYLFGVVITPNSGRVIDRYGQRFTMVFATAFSVAGILLTLSHSVPFIIAGLALASSGVFVSQSCSNSYIGIAAKHNKALAVGLYVTFYYAGGSLGSSLPGYLWAFGGWPACVALFAAVQVVTLSIALAWWERPAPAQIR